LRHLLHAILAILLWIVFVIYWRIVFQRPMSPETKIALFTLGSIAFLSILFLSVWVFHNILISKKLHRRKERRGGMREPNQDFMGRWIVIDHPEVLRRASYIEVEVKSNMVDGKVVKEKIFRPVKTTR
jgi:hypothetical protein